LNSIDNRIRKSCAGFDKLSRRRQAQPAQLLFRHNAYGTTNDENNRLTSQLAPRNSQFSAQAPCLTGTNNDENSQSASQLAPRNSQFSAQV
jgi:hypothetical protein